MIREINRKQIDIKTAYGERVLLVEAAPLQSFEASHIPGAIHMPLDQVKDLARRYLGNLGYEVVVYGQNDKSIEPELVARELERLGYCNLYLYRGGKEDWLGAGEFREALHSPPQMGNSTQAKHQHSLAMNASTSTAGARRRDILQRSYLLGSLAVGSLAAILGISLILTQLRKRVERRNSPLDEGSLPHRVVRIEHDSGYEVEAESFHAASAAE